jgi:hypothetical protein
MMMGSRCPAGGGWNNEISRHVVDVKVESMAAYSSIGYVAEEKIYMRHFAMLPMQSKEADGRYDRAMRYWLQTASHEVSLAHFHLFNPTVKSRLY